jgi:hypothetical protein
MKPCVGWRTRLRSSPAGAGPELMAETQARVEWAARDELSARGLCPNQVGPDPAVPWSDQIRNQVHQSHQSSLTKDLIHTIDWDGTDKPPHPREHGSSRIRPTLRVVQPASTRAHSFQHEQTGPRAPARLSARRAPVSARVFARSGFGLVPSSLPARFRVFCDPEPVHRQEWQSAQFHPAKYSWWGADQES